MDAYKDPDTYDNDLVHDTEVDCDLNICTCELPEYFDDIDIDDVY